MWGEGVRRRSSSSSSLHAFDDGTKKPLSPQDWTALDWIYKKKDHQEVKESRYHVSFSSTSLLPDLYQFRISSGSTVAPSTPVCTGYATPSIHTMHTINTIHTTDRWIFEISVEPLFHLSSHCRIRFTHCPEWTISHSTPRIQSRRLGRGSDASIWRRVRASCGRWFLASSSMQ